MRVSGHQTRSIFDRYDITSEADLEAATEQTSRYFTEKRTEAPRVVAFAPGRDENTDNDRDSEDDHATTRIATR